MQSVSNSIWQIYPNIKVWIDEVAAFIYQHAHLSVLNQGQFNLCLAGGSTPQKVYERLGNPPYNKIFPWEQTFLFWGDERAVPQDHFDSNFRMVNEALLVKVNIPREQVFAISYAEVPTEAAEKYDELLQNYIFDLTLLGLGVDGHTASLFPGTDILTSVRRAAAVHVPKLDGMRISVTADMINTSTKVAFLATGQAKSQILSRILNPSSSDIDYPAQLIRPNSGETYWLLDADSAAHLMMTDYLKS